MTLSIVIDGYYGFTNLGDEAILRALLKDISWAAPDSKVTVLSHNPDYTRDLHHVEAINRYDADAVNAVIRSADLVIVGGGGLFSEHYEPKFPNIFLQGYYYSTVLVAKIYEKPLYYYAIGLGPFFTLDVHKLVKFTLSLGDVLTLRDEYSLFLARSMGLKDALLTADPVCGLEITPQKPREKIIALSLRRWIEPSVEERVVQGVSQALETILKRHPTAKIALLPFQTDENYTDDRTILQQVQSSLAPELNQRVFFVVKQDPIEIANFIATCSLMIGERLHSLILSSVATIPFVALAYDAKVKSFCNSLGLDDFCIDIRQPFSAQELIVCVEDVFSKYDEICGTIQDKMQVLRARSLTNRQHLKNFLSKQTLENHQPDIQKNVVEEIFYDLMRSNKNLVKENLELRVNMQKINEYLMFLRTQLESAQAELANISNSHAWKLAKMLMHFRLWIMPHGSLRERVLKQMIQLMKVLRNQGPGVAIYIGVNKLFLLAQKRLSPKSQDLSWENFQNFLTANVNRYKGIYVIYSTIDWAFPYAQRPKLMALAMADLGYAVIYHTPNHQDAVNNTRKVANNLWITSIDVQRIELPHAVHAIYSTDLTILPEVLSSKKEKGQIIVYEYIDHISPLISGEDENIQRLLKLKDFAFCGGGDFIVATARQLEHEAIESVGREKVIYIPNGVNIEHYLNPKHRKTALPKKYKDFRKKYPVIVGYFGAIAPWLWYDMIRELTDAHPEWGFVFIGQDYNNSLAHLPRPNNLLHLGPIPYEILPSYARLFDVCFIPFAPGEIAKTTSPLKLFEYFALEKPVVVTSDMEECIIYKEVFFGDSASSIANAIKSAIEVKDDPDYRNKLSSLAMQNSWHERAKTYETIFRKRYQDEP